jgi:hypothetical protein
VAGTNWWVDTGGLGIAPGEAVVGGGGDTSVVSPRDPLDAARMANQFAPGASYPDGYLGTITDRQQDKLFTTVTGRLTDRSYQRGVHKGEKLGADQYFWTPDCNPEAGIRRQSMVEVDNQEGGIVLRTERYVPTGSPEEKLTAMGSRATLTPQQQAEVSKRFGVDPVQNSIPMTQSDPDRVARMQAQGMLPKYR